MWRKTCLLVAVALAAGLVLTRRRLGEAEAELERLRVTAGTSRVRREFVAGQPEAPSEEQKRADAPSDLAYEWEQVAPPMDS
ncbi:MAG: hypothetical protein ACXVUE_19515 [Solirubrobacteraceae bacterium]